jgi:fatty-acyl-CoA synthase
VSTWTGTSLRTISFGELGEQAGRLANALRGLGVGIGDRVATFHLRAVVVGGAAAPPAMMLAFEERHQVRVLHAWGMTETSPLGSVAHPPAGVSGAAAWAYRVTQGRFPAAVQARLTGEDGAVRPNDGTAVGELEVRGPWIAGAYYKPAEPGGPAETDQDRFRDGWLRTGDIATITPDGYLTLVDRAKDVIKSGGEWISSVDLENLVMEHPAVAEAAVIGVPDERWDERPLVFVVRRDGAAAAPEELRQFLAGKVARWQLPERWAFVDGLPKTSVGKFDKKALRASYADGAVDVDQLH